MSKITISFITVYVKAKKKRHERPVEYIAAVGASKISIDLSLSGGSCDGSGF